MSRYIGVDVPEPEQICNDINCPFHGTLRIRGRIINGTVMSHKMQKTIVIRKDFLSFVKKYKRYERKHTTISAHNPPCINTYRRMKKDVEKKSNRYLITETKQRC